MFIQMHDSGKDGGEYLTLDQIAEQRLSHKYVVVDYFARDIAETSDIYVAKVLYKGDNETKKSI